MGHYRCNEFFELHTEISGAVTYVLPSEEGNGTDTYAIIYGYIRTKCDACGDPPGNVHSNCCEPPESEISCKSAVILGLHLEPLSITLKGVWPNQDEFQEFGETQVVSQAWAVTHDGSVPFFTAPIKIPEDGGLVKFSNRVGDSTYPTPGWMGCCSSFMSIGAKPRLYDRWDFNCRADCPSLPPNFSDIDIPIGATCCKFSSLYPPEAIYPDQLIPESWGIRPANDYTERVSVTSNSIFLRIATQDDRIIQPSLVTSVSLVGDIADTIPPRGHPDPCGLSPNAPQNLLDWMRLYAGKYRHTATGFPPHCPCPPDQCHASEPLSFNRGWFSFSHNLNLSNPNCINMDCPPCSSTQRITWNDITHFRLNQYESCNTDLCYPLFHDNQYGGCARDFTKYYHNIYEKLNDPGELSSTTILIYPVGEQSSITGGALKTRDESWFPWVRLTITQALSTATIPDGPEFGDVFRYGGITKIESNVENIENLPVMSIMKPTAEVTLNPAGNIVVKRNTPFYYYVFFEQDWIEHNDR